MAIEDLTALTAKMILSRNPEGLSLVNAHISELPKQELRKLWGLVKKVLRQEDIEWFHATLKQS